MVDGIRPIYSNENLAEVWILENGSECVEALLQNFLAMRDEKETTGLAGILFSEAFIVKRRDDGLARPGRRNDQITVKATHFALGFESIEYFLLESVRSNVEREGLCVIRLVIALGLERTRETLPLILRIVFKFARIPVTFKSRRDLVDRFR